ncbi:hormogonium polysaccharide biosynthesis glycosyltransferase HpsE [Iningainema tapete]|uniref:Glycosyltransferase family 2 protein n=1 Tax=Iningainema tapete BLCC-T55 TaxID=2748662 RepID=A0A8J6XEV8_9CYAN|nr:hormogonium polysaccharide biosynthesis glycosyltransferase HpsE [Iningainema tapete]MBD2771460.1 glycosyltransferase family 2 protein [Iningainema tapete BLCC-T55]
MTEWRNFTVAIPTYNGEFRLPKLLERLRNQLKTEHFSWEIIVVDNNSTDNTAAVVKNYQASWHQPYPLRYCFETKQGAAYARQRAIEEASGSVVGFLDDDNYPSATWVQAAYTFAQNHPKAGAFGSQIHGEFEVKPPDNFEKIACFLAITERGAEPHRYEPHMKVLPPGAGLVVRKEAWCQTVPKRLVLNHKGRQAGLASEDLEAVLHIQLGGWEIWYNPEMQIYHQIPAWRLQKEYLLRLFRCVGLSRHHLRMLRIQPWQRPLLSIVYLSNDLRKIILHLLKYRGAIKGNLIAACEMELLVSSLISPFYLWSRKYLDGYLQCKFMISDLYNQWIIHF